MRKATDQRDAQIISLLWTSFLPFHGRDVPCWWCDLFWCHEVGCWVRWSNVVVCEVTWCVLNAVSCDVLCHVMSCDVMWWSCHLMWCDFLCCVMLRNAMRCHVMCSHVIPYLKWNVQYNARSNSLTDTYMRMHLYARALDLICNNISVTSYIAHNHINSPQVTSQLTTLRHQNTLPQNTWHHKIAEWRCAGQSPGGHPIGK